MNFKMEDLTSIVLELGEKLSGFENTSISYKKLQQLMEAVIYCIDELENNANDSIISNNISAKQVYELGYEQVINKVKLSLDIYNKLIPKFNGFENKCLIDTFINAIPNFFKYYDARFNPQSTILTLDYPILKDISMYHGVDKIYIYLKCISLEQEFLNQFHSKYIINILYKSNKDYKNTLDNLCYIVLLNLIGHIVIKKPITQSFEETDYIKIKKLFKVLDSTNIKNMLIVTLKNYYKNNNELLEYFIFAINDMSVRIENAVKFNCLNKLFVY